MFEESIKEGKPKPDFSGTDAHQVALTLLGEIQHPEFLRFLQKVGKERLASFTTSDLLILDAIQRDVPRLPNYKRKCRTSWTRASSRELAAGVVSDSFSHANSILSRSTRRLYAAEGPRQRD